MTYMPMDINSSNMALQMKTYRNKKECYLLLTCEDLTKSCNIQIQKLSFSSSRSMDQTAREIQKLVDLHLQPLVARERHMTKLSACVSLISR